MSLTIPLVPSDTIWLAHGPFPTGTAIGLGQGWFEKAFAYHGFKVNTLQESREPAMRAQHFYHDIKTLIRDGGNVLPLWTRARNLHAKGWDNTVIVGLTWLDEAQVLLARPGCGVRPGDLSSLRGKRLGLSRAEGEIDVWRAMQLRGFATVLGLANLSFDDVILKDVITPPVQWHEQSRVGVTGARAVETALLNDEVDVIYVKGATAIQLQQEYGLDIILDINSLKDPGLRINNGTPRPVTVHRHFLDDHPELVVAHLRVLNAAAAWARGHGNDLASVLAADIGATADSVRRGYGPHLSAGFDVNLNATRVDALQSQADFLARHVLVDGRVNVRDWIDTGPLLAALADPLKVAA